MSYYVYELVDPRTGDPFYIGKGKGDRIAAHEAEARKGIHSRKCDRIREIWAAELKVQRRILSRFKQEHEAYAAEKQLIEDIGLANLTNVVPGGVYVPRVKVAEKRWSMYSLLRLAPSIARASREYAKHGNLFALGVHDITASFQRLIKELVADCGADAVSREVEKHGVTLKFVGMGA